MGAERVRIDKTSPEPYRALIAVSQAVGADAEAAGIPRGVVELVNLRCSQINGCAFCLTIHHSAAIKAGITQQQVAVLPAWRDAPLLFGEMERAALEIAELVTALPPHEVADLAYDAATDCLDAKQTSALIWVAVAINAFNRVSILSRYTVEPRP